MTGELWILIMTVSYPFAYHPVTNTQHHSSRAI